MEISYEPKTFLNSSKKRASFSVSLLSDIPAWDTVLPITFSYFIWLVVGTWFWLKCFDLMMATVVQRQRHFHHLIPQMHHSPFLLHQEVQFLLFFSLFIPFRGIINLISSLKVFGGGFAIISIRKLVIERPNTLSLTRWSYHPSNAFVTQTDLKADMTSILAYLLELTNSVTSGIRWTA